MRLLRFTYGEIRRWLARRQSCAFAPLADAQGSGGRWSLRGADPALEACPQRGLYPRGWYMLEVRVDSDLPLLAGKLYVDYGEGYSESECFPIALPSGELVKRLCFFSRLPRALRFDPSECPTEVEILQFVLARVSRRFALQAIERKLRASPFVSEEKMAALANCGASAERLERAWELYHELVSPSSAADYSTMIARERLAYGAESVRQRLENFSCRPRISVVVPVYDPAPELLERCIASVRDQLYPDWQLCLADDASTNPEIGRILRAAAEADTRVDWMQRESNGHICHASNSALELATGDFVALLDHDDELAPQALLEVAAALQERRDAQILYSDEDKIDEKGARCEPHFKPDWNRDLLYSQNYVSHLGVFRTDLIRSVGGFRPGYEGSQDYDLLLRCVEQISAEKIVHIPKVLYHWRAGAGSTALSADEKGYTTDAGIRALGEHLQRCGVRAEVEQGIAANTFRVRYQLPDLPPLVSLLIPTRDGYEILRQCVESILEKTTYSNYEIVVLNNQTSCEKTLAYFEEISQRDGIRVVDYDYHFNYSAMNNFGVANARGELVALVNNDIEVISRDWLTEMASQALRPEIGCVGAKLYYPNDTLQHAGVVLGLGGVAGHSHKHASKEDPGYFYRPHLIQNYSAVTAACLLVRKAVFEEVGGLNAKDLAVAFNDVDFCLRVREAGYRNLWTPYAELYHHESISRGSDEAPEKLQRFHREIRYMQSRWGDRLKIDPAYNCNLTLDYENFSLR